MKLQPLHDMVLIRTKVEPGTGALYAAFAAASGQQGEVVALGAICGKSEAQGVKPGSVVIFDKSKAEGCGPENPGLWIVGEDYIRAVLVEEDTESN